MDAYSDFICLIYKYLYKYKLLQYNKLITDEMNIWPKWIGIDITIKLLSASYSTNHCKIKNDFLYKDNNNILHSAETIVIYADDNVSLFDLIEKFMIDLYMYHVKPIQYGKNIMKKISTVPEINEFSDCGISYCMFLNNISQYYKQCCILKNNINAEKDLYEIFFEFSEKYRSLLIIKEYLKKHGYKKNYSDILAAKDGLQIIKLEKQIFLSMYNILIKNKIIDKFNFCGEETVPKERSNKEKYHQHFAHWCRTVFKI